MQKMEIRRVRNRASGGRDPMGWRRAPRNLTGTELEPVSQKSSRGPGLKQAEIILNEAPAVPWERGVVWLKKNWLHNGHGGIAVTGRRERITAGGFQRAWWQCPVGHIWKAVIYSRAGPR